jgi:hypothetical protein
LIRPHTSDFSSKAQYNKKQNSEKQKNKDDLFQERFSELFYIKIGIQTANREELRKKPVFTVLS